MTTDTTEQAPTLGDLRREIADLVDHTEWSRLGGSLGEQFADRVLDLLERALLDRADALDRRSNEIRGLVHQLRRKP